MRLLLLCYIISYNIILYIIRIYTVLVRLQYVYVCGTSPGFRRVAKKNYKFVLTPYIPIRRSDSRCGSTKLEERSEEYIIICNIGFNRQRPKFFCPVDMIRVDTFVILFLS